MVTRLYDGWADELAGEDEAGGGGSITLLGGAGEKERVFLTYRSTTSYHRTLLNLKTYSTTHPTYL